MAGAVPDEDLNVDRKREEKEKDRGKGVGGVSNAHGEVRRVSAAEDRGQNEGRIRNGDAAEWSGELQVTRKR